MMCVDCQLTGAVDACDYFLLDLVEDLDFVEWTVRHVQGIGGFRESRKTDERKIIS